MILIVDNDAILKLAAFDLLNASCNLFRVEPSAVVVLPSAKYYFRQKRDKLTEKYTFAGVDRAIAFVENASPITQTTNPDDADMLSGIEFLDAGELQLFAHTRDIPESILMTGDKRCLRALANSSKARPVYTRMSHRIVCLEVLVQSLIVTIGFDAVRASIVPAMKCDTAIRACFGSGYHALEESVIPALNSYIEELEREVGDHWLKHRLTR